MGKKVLFFAIAGISFLLLFGCVKEDSPVSLMLNGATIEPQFSAEVSDYKVYVKSGEKTGIKLFGEGVTVEYLQSDSPRLALDSMATTKAVVTLADGTKKEFFFSYYGDTSKQVDVSLAPLTLENMNIYDTRLSMPVPFSEPFTPSNYGYDGPVEFESNSMQISGYTAIPDVSVDVLIFEIGSIGEVERLVRYSDISGGMVYHNSNYQSDIYINMVLKRKGGEKSQVEFYSDNGLTFTFDVTWVQKTVYEVHLWRKNQNEVYVVNASDFAISGIVPSPDAPQGSLKNPYFSVATANGSIQTAINKAYEIGAAEVRLGAGGPYALSSPIVMKPGVSLLGGWNNSNLTSRNTIEVFANRTTDTEMSVLSLQGSSSNLSWDYTILFDGTLIPDHIIDNETVLSGVKINSYSQTTKSSYAGIQCVGNANPTIMYNNIYGGMNTSSNSSQSMVGISVSDSSPVIISNKISAGIPSATASGGEACAIYWYDGSKGSYSSIINNIFVFGYVQSINHLSAGLRVWGMDGSAPANLFVANNLFIANCNDTVMSNLIAAVYLENMNGTSISSSFYNNLFSNFESYSINAFSVAETAPAIEFLTTCCFAGNWTQLNGDVFINKTAYIAEDINNHTTVGGGGQVYQEMTSKTPDVNVYSSSILESFYCGAYSGSSHWGAGVSLVGNTRYLHTQGEDPNIIYFDGAHQDITSSFTHCGPVWRTIP